MRLSLAAVLFVGCGNGEGDGYADPTVFTADATLGDCEGVGCPAADIVFDFETEDGLCGVADEALRVEMQSSDLEITFRFMARSQGGGNYAFSDGEVSLDYEGTEYNGNWRSGPIQAQQDVAGGPVYVTTYDLEVTSTVPWRLSGTFEASRCAY